MPRGRYSRPSAAQRRSSPPKSHRHSSPRPSQSPKPPQPHQPPPIASTLRPASHSETIPIPARVTKHINALISATPLSTTSLHRETCDFLTTLSALSVDLSVGVSDRQNGDGDHATPNSSSPLPAALTDPSKADLDDWLYQPHTADPPPPPRLLPAQLNVHTQLNLSTTAAHRGLMSHVVTAIQQVQWRYHAVLSPQLSEYRHQLYYFQNSQQQQNPPPPNLTVKINDPRHNASYLFHSPSSSSSSPSTSTTTTPMTITPQTTVMSLIHTLTLHGLDLTAQQPFPIDSLPFFPFTIQLSPSSSSSSSLSSCYISSSPTDSTTPPQPRSSLPSPLPLHLSLWDCIDHSHLPSNSTNDYTIEFNINWDLVDRFKQSPFFTELLSPLLTSSPSRSLRDIISVNHQGQPANNHESTTQDASSPSQLEPIPLSSFLALGDHNTGTDTNHKQDNNSIFSRSDQRLAEYQQVHRFDLLKVDLCLQLLSGLELATAQLEEYIAELPPLPPLPLPLSPSPSPPEPVPPTSDPGQDQDPSDVDQQSQNNSPTNALPDTLIETSTNDDALQSSDSLLDPTPPSSTDPLTQICQQLTDIRTSQLNDPDGQTPNNSSPTSTQVDLKLKQYSLFASALEFVTCDEHLDRLVEAYGADDLKGKSGCKSPLLALAIEARHILAATRLYNHHHDRFSHDEYHDLTPLQYLFNLSLATLDIIDAAIEIFGSDQVHSSSPSLPPPLALAIGTNNIPVARHLVTKYGADPHVHSQQNQNIFHLAVSSVQGATLELISFIVDELGCGDLINDLDSDGVSPLALAVGTTNLTNLDLVHSLVTHGANLHWVAPNHWTLLHMASDNPKCTTELIHLLIDPIKDGGFGLIQYLTQPVGVDECLPLTMALRRNNIPVVKLLLSRHPRDKLEVLTHSQTFFSNIRAIPLGLIDDYFALVGLDFVNSSDNGLLSPFLLVVMLARFDIARHMRTVYKADCHRRLDDPIYSDHVIKAIAMSANKIEAIDFVMEVFNVAENHPSFIDTMFMTTARLHNFPTVRHLIENHNANVNLKFDNAQNLLHLTCLSRAPRRRANRGVETEAQWLEWTDTFDYFVSVMGQDAIEVLDDFDNCPLVTAICDNDIPLARHLINKHGAKVNYPPSDRLTLLHLAVTHSTPSTIDFLIDELKRPVNERARTGCTPLHTATRSGDLIRFRHFTTKYASQIDFNATDNEGLTVLHYAACHGAIDIIDYCVSKLKLSHQINAVTPSPESTPLHEAFRKGHLATARHLINHHKAKIHVPLKNKSTLLHVAALHGHIPVIDFVVNELGFNTKAHFEAKVATGHTPFQLALHTRAFDAASHLKELEAKAPNSKKASGRSSKKK